MVELTAKFLAITLSLTDLDKAIQIFDVSKAPLKNQNFNEGISGRLCMHLVYIYAISFSNFLSYLVKN